MEGSFEKINIGKLPEGDRELNDCSEEVRNVLDDMDRLKAAIAVEENNVKKMELLGKLEIKQNDLNNLMIAMDQRKEKLDRIKREKGKIGNA